MIPRERRRKEKTLKSEANQTVLTSISNSDQAKNFQFQITPAVCYSQSSRHRGHVTGHQHRKKNNLRYEATKTFWRRFWGWTQTECKWNSVSLPRKRNPQSYVIECSWHKHRGSQTSFVVRSYSREKRLLTSCPSVRTYQFRPRWTNFRDIWH
jgi:hypothetical protein